MIDASTGTGLGAVGLTQTVGADQGVDGRRKDVLRLPADGVEGQHHASGGARAFGAGGVFGVDGGGVFRLHAQAATDGDHAVAQRGVGIDQDAVGGNQAVGRDRSGPAALT